MSRCRVNEMHPSQRRGLYTALSCWISFSGQMYSGSMDSLSSMKAVLGSESMADIQVSFDGTGQLTPSVTRRQCRMPSAMVSVVSTSGNRM